jgi:tetratricopeptide (TPR) repeat protein
LADAQHLPEGRRQAGDRHLKFHDVRGNLPALARLGEVCHLLGDLDDAATHLHRSLAVAGAVGDRAIEASAWADRAAIAVDQGRLTDANSHVQAAIAALGHQDHWTEVECRTTLGRVMHRLGRIRDAADEYTRALEMAGSADRCAPAVIALIGLSEVHRSRGELNDAVTCAQEALRISQAVGYRVLEGQAHAAAAEAALREGGSEAARQHASWAIEIQQGTGHRLGEARAKVVLGRADARTCMSDWRDALAIFRRCGAEPEAAATEELIRSASSAAP